MIVVGTDEADNLNGTAGADEIFGRMGDDFLFGLAGNDVFYWNAGHGNAAPNRARIEGSDGSDVMDGGANFDRLYITADYSQILSGRNSDTGLVERVLTAQPNGQAVFVTTQSWNNYGTTPSSGTSFETLTLRNIEALSYAGTRIQPEPTGLSFLFNTARDRISVGDLSDTALTGELVFDLGADTDRLDAGEAVNRIVALGGDGADELIGGAGNDELYGEAGSDILHGGGGVNALVGGVGDDIYYSDNNNDSILEAAGGGFDRIVTAAGYFMSRDNIEMLSYAGAGDFIGIGGEGAETIEGGAGNDYLIGFGGDDVLDGLGGANTLQGGRGDDLYRVRSADDTLVEFAGEGQDTVEAAIANYALRDNFENLTSAGTGNFTGTGNALANVLTGGAGADRLTGLAGDDRLIGGGGANILDGGTGDDTYVVSSNADTIVERAGEGTDTVLFAGTSFTMAEFVENLTITAAVGAAIQGNGLANLLVGGAGGDKLVGLAGNDILRGGAGNDILDAGAGDDVLLGGPGGDELAGGAGADRFVFTTLGDVKDLIHDFARGEGDRIDVSALLRSVGYAGADSWADGYLATAPVEAFGSTGVPGTRVLFDPDGATGPQATTDLIVVLGGTQAVVASDFIFA